MLIKHKINNNSRNVQNNKSQAPVTMITGS